MTKMNNIRISIITPTFNSERFLSYCLDSIKQQKGNFKIQHIIVDGNSKDKTFEILKKYKKSADYDVKIIVGKDKNMYDAINKGMKHVEGDIWACLNSDDMYVSGALKKVCRIFRNNANIEALYGSYKAVDAQGNFLYKRYLPGFNLNKLIRMGSSSIMPQPTTFMRKIVISKVGNFNIVYKYAADYDFQIRMGKKCKVMMIQDVLTLFRRHEQAASSSDNSQYTESREISLKHMNKKTRYIRHKIDWFQFYLLQLNIKNLSFIINKLFRNKDY